VILGRILAGRSLESSAEEQMENLKETEEGVKATDAKDKSFDNPRRDS
jgi:hypothetical protein